MNHSNSGGSATSELLEKVASRLEGLINSRFHKERECRKCLGYAEDLLFKNDVLTEIRYSEPELKGTSGVSDYVVSGVIGNDPMRNDCVRGYIWELKAPQYFWFKKDGENRLCPTKELIEAENQLLNYYDDLKLNPKMVDRFKVGHPDRFCIGGIIIGSRNRLVKGKLEEKKRSDLFNDAWRIRKTYFYDRVGIVLLTWSQVLDFINKKFINITKEGVDPDHPFKANKMKEGTKGTEEIIQKS